MDLQPIWQLILATALGALIGLERELKQKGAGLKTYALTSLGSCLFAILSLYIVDFYGGEKGIYPDPTRIIQAVAIGIGFIGAGVIFHHGGTVIGLTTGAGLWVTAAIGLAVGVRFYLGAILTTLLALFVFYFFEILEEKIFKTKGS